MNWINQIVARLGKKKVLIVIGILAAIAVYFFAFSDKNVAIEATDITTPEVTTAAVRSLSGGVSFGAVGTVRAVSEAELHAEAGGRVVAVYPTLGSTVQAGSIVARLDGAAQSAVMLQAQGAYEAAQAGARSGTVSIEQAQNALTAAQNQAISAERGAYTAVNDAFLNKINDVLEDTFISSPSVVLIGSKLPFLTSEGDAFEIILPKWQMTSAELKPTDDLDTALANAKEIVKRTLVVTDDLITVLNDSKDGSYTIAGKTTEVHINLLTSLRSTLNGTLATLEAAEVGLRSARDAQKQAAISGTSDQVSVSSAQVKIALGSLRAAQAAYEKTLVRTPITGVVNALYLKAGEYATPGQSAAIIANNNGLEIETSVSQEDSLELQVNDTVTIDGTATGTINAIAGAIDPTTGKVALKISVNDNGTLQNGATVAVSFASSNKTAAADITIPLASVKMTGSGPVVFTIDSAASTLVAQPIVLGAISGETVVVASGLTPDTVIVTDGRGLKAGQKVIVVTK